MGASRTGGAWVPADGDSAGDAYGGIIEPGLGRGEARAKPPASCACFHGRMFRNDRPFHGWLDRNPQAQRGAASIGRALHDARLRARISQRRLEDATGVDQTTISRLERGIAPGLRLERLGQIVEALGGDIALCPHVAPVERSVGTPDPDPW